LSGGSSGARPCTEKSLIIGFFQAEEFRARDKIGIGLVAGRTTRKRRAKTTRRSEGFRKHFEKRRAPGNLA